jgi:phage tail-like protein
VQGEITTRNVTLKLYDYTGKQVLRTWVFREAFPVKWASTSLTAEQNAVAFETLTLAHQGMAFAQ